MGLRNPSHWVVLIVVLILVLGATRLPMIAKNLGQSMKIFKKEMKELSEDDGKNSSSNTPGNSGNTNQD
ncbi:sec-independent protein translocase protein TatA [Micrococcales bacterium KH10]|nr:sec-independent protein translocase protein TatA [Micrococcales bacterium KH10]